MKVFYELISKKRKLIIVFIVLGISISLLSTVSVNYFQKLLDDFQNKDLNISIIVMYSIMLILKCVLSYIDNYPYTQIDNYIYLSLKLSALKKISTINYIDYQKLGIGKLVQQIENGANAGKSILFDFYFVLFRELIPNVLFSLFFIAKININIMKVIGIGYIIVFIITNVLLKYLYKIKEHILINEEILNKYLVRGLMELVVFRINKRFKSEIEKVNDASSIIINSKTKIKMIHELFFALFALIVIVIKITIISYSLFESTLSIGELVALVTLVDKAYNPIAIFNVLFIQYKLDKVAFNRYIEILELPDDKNIIQGNKPLIKSGKIQFDNVDFYYDGKEIFKNLSFEIPEKSSVAFVGESGSGKSTIIKQIVGLLKPTKGKILVDNYNLNDISLEHFYDFISYTSQESPIFDGTLRENIVFDSNVCESEILRVLELVGLKEFYEGLPNGLDTQVGEKGIMISGGERQRLALSRIFFNKAKIVILDEATSAMDNITEEIVMNNLMSYLKDKTLVVIAHRLNTIRNFDIIYALKNGKIVGKGNFQELINENYYFNNLWNAKV